MHSTDVSTESTHLSLLAAAMKSAARPDPPMTTMGVFFSMASRAVLTVFLPPSRMSKTTGIRYSEILGFVIVLQTKIIY